MNTFLYFFKLLDYFEYCHGTPTRFGVSSLGIWINCWCRLVFNFNFLNKIKSRHGPLILNLDTKKIVRLFTIHFSASFSILAQLI